MALRLARSGEPPAADERKLQGELRTTLGRVFRREPEGVAVLPQLLRACPPELRQTLVDAVVKSSAEGRLLALAKALGRVPGFDPILLVEIRRLVPAYSGAATDIPMDRVRPYLTPSDPTLAILASQCAAAIGDQESLPALIDLVDGTHAGAAAAAHRALVDLTGLTWGSDPTVWRRWGDDEYHWWQTLAPECADAIAGTDSARAGDAILELSRHRAYPDRAAEMLIEGLNGPLATALLACRALRAVRSDRAYPHLVELLNHTDSQLRAAAHDALCARTELDLPPESELWSQQLELVPTH